jgi:hypothetical protein
MHGYIETIIYFKAPHFIEEKKEKEKMTRRYWNINLEEIFYINFDIIAEMPSTT